MTQSQPATTGRGALPIVIAIATAGFRRGLRGRLGLVAVASLVGIGGLGLVFHQFADRATLEYRLITETGLALSAILVLGTSLLLACRGLGTDDDRHAVHALLALPIPRPGIILGHLVGIWLTLAVYSLALTLSLTAVLYLRFGFLRPALFLHMLTLFVEGCALATFATLIALGGSTIVAFFGTIALAFVTHAEATVVHLVQRTAIPALDAVVATLYRLLPAFAALDVKASTVREVPIPWSQLAWGLPSVLLWTIAVAFVACLVFARREP